MFYSKRSILLFVVCFVQTQHGNAVNNTLVTRLNNSLSTSEEFFILNESPYTYGNLLYARCSRQSSKSIKCNVVQENHPNARNCLITIEDDDEASNLNSYIGLNAVGKDMAMISWGSSNMGLISFEACAFKPQNFNKKYSSLRPNKIVPREDDSWDVFFNDPEHCGDKLCKIRIKSDATVESEPIPSNIAGGLVHYISLIDASSVSKGYGILKEIDKYMIFLLVKPDGTEKQLAQYDDTTCPTVLASNSAASVCTKTNADSDVTCMQYDEDGKAKFTTTIADQNENTRAKALYNLPNGEGMIVMLAAAKKADRPASLNSDIKYRLVKIAADGKVLGTTPIQEINDIISKVKITNIDKHGDSGYCVTIIGLTSTDNEQKRNEYVTLANCLRDSDFSI